MLLFSLKNIQTLQPPSLVCCPLEPGVQVLQLAFHLNSLIRKKSLETEAPWVVPWLVMISEPPVRCGQGWLLLRPPSSACRRPPPPCVLTWLSLGALRVFISSFYEDTSPTGAGPSHRTPF